MSKLVVTIGLEELQSMLEEACNLGMGSSEVWGDYTASGIAYTIIAQRKILSKTMIGEESPTLPMQIGIPDYEQ